MKRNMKIRTRAEALGEEDRFSMLSIVIQASIGEMRHPNRKAPVFAHRALELPMNLSMIA